ncbi:hypothetical protein FACS1894217_02770 [Clostridia bacterium]|nr:hypothetical protein FACS1894217_02770 [Clostridia bacterium]
MNRKTRLIALLLAISMMVSAFGAVGLATSNDSLQLGINPSDVISENSALILAENPGRSVTAIKSLYDTDEDVIAYCIELSGDGFIVQDISGEVVEYCLDAESPFEAVNADEKVYITAPMSYFTEDTAGDFVDVYSGETVSKEALDENNAVQERVEENLAANDDVAPASPGIMALASYSPPSGSVTASGQTPYTPRNYSYNPTSICLATAAATVLVYYDEHINGNIVPSSYATSSGENLTSWLAARIYPGANGSAATYAPKTSNAMSEFMGLYSVGTGVQYSTSYVTGTANTYSMLKSKVAVGKPIVIVFDGWFADQSVSELRIVHAVCAYGYRDVMSTNGAKSSYALCIDGWGNTQRYITSSYLTAASYLS